MPCRNRQSGTQPLSRRSLPDESCPQRRSDVSAPAAAPIRTRSLLEWATMYLNYAQARFTVKTYKEKRFVFRQLFRTLDSGLDAALLHKGDALAYFTEQARIRSGYAANKDRKNLIAAWNWGIRHIPDFPDQNPFLTDRFAEERSPRRMPLEKDFWAVYASAESDQDRLMLLCYLHLAARRNEIFHLRREDIDLDLCRVRLRTRKTTTQRYVHRLESVRKAIEVFE